MTTMNEERAAFEVIGYASPGQVEILRKLPRTGGMKVKGCKDGRYTEPVVLLSVARAALFATVIRCEQAGAFKACMECGYQDGHDEICQFHASNRNPQQSAHVSVPSGGRSIFAMILQALDRDAAEGKEARGEMAAELRALLNGGEA